MKHAIRRSLFLVLALSLLCMAISATLVNDTDESSLPLADHVSLVTGGWELSSAPGSSGQDASYVREHMITYQPNDTVWPVVVYGNTLYGRSTMAQTAKYLTEDGYSIVAAINGSFFDMQNGIPYGIIVTDGVLRSSGSGYAVGFLEDGSAIIGEPELTVSLQMPDGTALNTFYNKALSATNGVGLYSQDYDAKTKNTVSAYNVILQPLDGQSSALSLNGSIRVKVTGSMAATPSCPIPDGSFVLSIAESTSYASVLQQLKSLQTGDTLTITTAANDAWRDVVYACGGGDLLVENGRAVEEDSFTLDTADERRARTAVGLKKDGTIIFYTADNAEQKDHSNGLTLAELAERLETMGCELALNLDGGGSTALGAQYPGYGSCVTVNTPADGSLRPCANFIYLIRKQSLSRQATQLYLYPYAQAVLPGTKIALTVKAADEQYMPATLPGTVSYSATGASVTADGVVSVDKNASSSGKVVITARAGNLSAQVSLPVVHEVTELKITKQDSSSAISSITVAGGSTTELSAAARSYGREVAAQDSCFSWQCDESIGTIDENGTFTAASTAGKLTGSITVSYGQRSAELSVTVAASDPFVDMKNHWAKGYVNEMYYDGVLAGSTGSDGKLRYRPDDSMTRQEFVVALMRFMGIDTTRYSSVQLPFVDADATADWALNAMKAAYALGYVGGSGSSGRLYGNPTSTITRQEAMVILARSQNLTQATDRTALSRFSDAGLVADWAAESLAAMIERNIIGGSNGKLNPTGKVTRAEVAKMLYALKYQN